MQHVFWLIPNVLAGRSGPDCDPWDLSELRHAGIGAVLSVNYGEQCDAEEFVRYGINYACISLSSSAPPLIDDAKHNIETLPKAYEFVQGQMRNGHATLVHCSGGKDRTGLFLAYFLMKHQNLSPTAAFAEVRRVRPIAFTADGWEDLALDVLTSAE